MWFEEQRFKKHWNDYIINTEKCKDYWIYPEIISLLHNLRRFIFILGPSPNSFYKIKKICNTYGLKMITVDDKFVIYKSDEDTSEFIEIFQSGKDDIKIGILLGYPKCCYKFYHKYFSKGIEVNPITTYKNSKKPFSFYLNNTQKLTSVISHFPCNYNCKKSIELSKKILSIIKELNGNEIYKELIDLLKNKSVFCKGLYFTFKEFNVPYPVNNDIAKCFGINNASKMSINENYIKSILPDGKIKIAKENFLLFDFE